MDDTIENWLKVEMEGADAAARESHRFAMNSYGAGHDAGYLAALTAVRDALKEHGYAVA